MRFTFNFVISLTRDFLMSIEDHRLYLKKNLFIIENIFSFIFKK